MPADFVLEVSNELPVSVPWWQPSWVEFDIRQCPVLPYLDHRDFRVEDKCVPGTVVNSLGVYIEGPGLLCWVIGGLWRLGSEKSWSCLLSGIRGAMVLHRGLGDQARRGLKFDGITKQSLDSLQSRIFVVWHDVVSGRGQFDELMFLCIFHILNF